MSTKYKDHIGQEIEVGDWVAITQNNKVIAGKVISISSKGSPTIARNSVEEYCHGNGKWKKLNSSWKTSQQAREMLVKKFPRRYKAQNEACIRLLSWVRDTKFIKINPTEDMIIKYDV